MKIDPLIKQRFAELEKKATDLAATILSTDWGDRVDSSKFQEWATSVLSLLQRVFNDNSPQFKNFHDKYIAFKGYFSDFELCLGIFRAAKEDYESGYLFNVRSLIKAEDSTDILEQATELLESEYKDPACVLSGVSLEITLKELCVRNGIPIAKLDAMNIELCKKGVYNMGKQKQITSWSHWRNKAAHGEWDEYKKEDVEGMIIGVTQFIADYL